MRYLVYDEDGVLQRKFWDEFSARKYLQDGWKLVVLPKQRKPKLHVDMKNFEEARW